jgi:hypothetical protein
MVFGTALIFLSAQIFYTICKFVIDNFANIADLEIVSQIGILTLTLLFLLTMLKRETKGYIIHKDKLEINYFFGLFTRSYDFRGLKFSFYSWTTKVALLEFPNGSQLTLGKSQYLNFDEIVEILKQELKMRS